MDARSLPPAQRYALNPKTGEPLWTWRTDSPATNVKDNDTFSPSRAQIQAGHFVRFMNNGRMVHAMKAEDGSWTLGPFKPAQQGSVRFEKPGTYIYHCREHPGAIGQIVVRP